MSGETTAARAAAGYRPGTGFRRCWNCEEFRLLPAGAGMTSPTGDLPPPPEDAPPADHGRPVPTCDVVRGAVEPTAVCDRWVQMADTARKRTGFRSAQRQHGRFLWDDGPGGPAGDDGGASGL